MLLMRQNHICLRQKRSSKFAGLQKGIVLDMKNYTDINAEAIDRWGENGWPWSIPISREAYADALRGKWRFVLTPQKAVPEEWFAPYMKNRRLEGVKLLGLASGGGQQMPLFAALGADCIVVDYSRNQLRNEQMVSEREGYAIEIVRADMTKTLPFADESFDVIFHPVSNCYVEDVYHIWSECHRVLRKGGILLAGMSNGINFLAEDDNPLLVVNKLPYNPLKDEKLLELSRKSDSGIQFSHTITEQIGGQLKAGLTLTDLYEDTDGEGIGAYIPNYLATRVVK